MKKFLSFLAVILISTAAFAQSVTLTFTAKDAANHYVQLNRVSITNLTKGWQETIYWPDTTLTMQNGTGINDIVGANDHSPLRLSQNNPNPFTGTTVVSLMVANEGTVTIDIADINGRIVVVNDYLLQPGTHQFRIILAIAGTYVMTARQNGQTSSIKMVCNGGTDANKMEIIGNVGTQFIASESPTKNAPKYTTTHPFTFGDQMEYVGYAIINGSEAESQHITQVQDASQTFALVFATPTYGQPCPGTPTVTDHEGNVYNTVQIGNQCWMKENLRTTTSPSTGTYIISESETGTWTGKQAFWYDNDSATYAPMSYGLLYNWNAAVDTFNVVYGETSINTDCHNAVSVIFNGHRRGICPAGWHLPGDSDWGELSYYVGSQSEYVCEGNTICGGNTDNIAKALASSVGWDNSTTICAIGNDLSANNATGFSVVPAGVWNGSSFNYVGIMAIFRSTYQPVDASATEAFRLRHYDVCAFVGNFSKLEGYSVRCVRD